MKKTLTAGFIAAALAILPATAAFADGHEAEVVVVHGVPGLEVDILAGGEPVIEGFNYTDIEVLNLPAGSYDLGVAAAGTTDAILSITASVEAGKSYTVAAYLDADGDPTIGAFANETSATGIQPFHLANFPEVAVIAGGDAVLDNVANGVTARIDVPGGATVEGVGLGLAGTTDIALEIGDVTVPADTLLLVFATGPSDADLPDITVQTVSVASADAGDEMERPSAEHSPGEAGLASTALPTWAIALMLVGALSLAAPAVASARSRR